MEIGRLPHGLQYVHSLMAGGVTVTFLDVAAMDAITWGDIRLYREAQGERERVEAEKATAPSNQQDPKRKHDDTD